VDELEQLVAERTQELQQALQSEIQLNVMRTHFTSMVSHEFRTPLTVILSSSEILKTYGDRLAAEQRIAHLNKIATQVRRLTDLLNEFLDFSKAEAFSVEFNPIPLDLYAFCRDLVEEIQTNAGARQIAFSANSQSAGFVGDEKLLRQIVANLLTNAIKYSPQGGKVELDLICEQGEAVIRVKDEGMGIPKEDQTHLFEPFHRAGNVGAIHGTGLGLAIVKRAVEAHHGTVSVESEVGRGTTFAVHLPLPASE
jgi:signal transduction histidine kinase